MVTGDDNIFEGKTYEECLFIVCDRDLDRYKKACESIGPILAKIPMGWKDV